MLNWEQDKKNNYLVAKLSLDGSYDFRFSIAELADTPGILAVIDLYTDQFKMDKFTEFLNLKGFDVIYVGEGHTLAPDYGECILAYIYDSSVRDAKISCEWWVIEFKKVMELR